MELLDIHSALKLVRRVPIIPTAQVDIRACTSYFRYRHPSSTILSTDCTSLTSPSHAIGLRNLVLVMCRRFRSLGVLGVFGCGTRHAPWVIGDVARTFAPSRSRSAPGCIPVVNQPNPHLHLPFTLPQTNELRLGPRPEHGGHFA